MALLSTAVSIHPYFQIHPGQLDAFSKVIETFIETTGTEEGCLYYDFTLNGDEAFCREAYTDGDTALTAFLPTDQAFRDLVGDLTGKRPKTEKKTVDQLIKLAGVDTIETVLLYHVVAGKTLASPKVIAASKQRAKLKTAQGGKVKVTNVKGNITLVDKDPDLADPVVILNGIDVNKGNRQIGHAIDGVLLPVDL